MADGDVRQVATGLARNRATEFMKVMLADMPVEADIDARYRIAQTMARIAVVTAAFMEKVENGEQ